MPPRPDATRPGRMSTPTPMPTSWPEIDWLSPAARVDVAPPPGWYAASKPAVDYVLAVVLLALTMPLIAACWVLVKLTSPGPGFYTQTRAGRGQRPYKIVKLRTMGHNCEARSGIRWAVQGDTRVTAVGRFLRATHFDELPQLFNVLRGEMSLVGPRPERPEVIAAKNLTEKVVGYRERLRVRPGVTGLAQVQLPADTDLSSVRYKVVYDLYYVAHESLWLDLRLLGATVLKAAGVGPHWLRRLFLLPDRDAVARMFRSTLNPPPPPPEPESSSTELAPA